MELTCINRSRNSYKTSIGFYKFFDKIQNVLKVLYGKKVPRYVLSVWDENTTVYRCTSFTVHPYFSCLEDYLIEKYHTMDISFM